MQFVRWFEEVGLADALGREVILICQHDKVPFDFSGQRLILYENSIAGAFHLQDRLKERLAKVKSKTAAASETHNSTLQRMPDGTAELLGR